jgi:hypothetical protein
MLISRLVLVLGLLTPPAVRAIETPEYELVDRLGKAVEVRCYPAMQLATTIVEGTQNSVGNKAFRRLAGYIFGDNQSQQKIAMTAPVMQSRTSERAYEVAFVMPAALTEAPQPDSSLVRLEDRSLLVAVTTYKGGWSARRYSEHLTLLSDALAEQTEWIPAGEPIWARYDPPFKPWFLRTNEIMLPVLPLENRVDKGCELPSTAG